MNKIKKYISVITVVLIAVTNVSGQVNVDKFTGNASYGLPLITVPNFRGPSVPTSISYNSDIKVDQPASEIGLGWNINAGGSIERMVNGVPDDWKNVNTADVSTTSFIDHLGALYVQSYPDAFYDADFTDPTKILDFNYTRYKMDTLNDSIRFYYPNYDSYYVTGGSMPGEIIPMSFEYTTVTTKKTDLTRMHYYANDTDEEKGDVRAELYGMADDQNSMETVPKFYYKHDYKEEVNSRYYPWDESPLSGSSDLYEPGGIAGKTFDGAAYHDEDYSETANKNRARTANYIEYYTNSEIIAGVTGFIECDELSTRTGLPSDGIGAYQITTLGGYTFHYSLPVYAHFTKSLSYRLDNENNIIPIEEGEVVETENEGSYFIENPTSLDVYGSKQNEKYAIRWLLTAVTGPDYEDSNSDGEVDLDDEGYWVKYEYGKWSDSFDQRSPYYGSSYAFTAGLDDASEPFMDVDNKNANSGKIISNTETAEQIYYLNKILTPTHTGIFCRDFRLDEQSPIAEYDKSEYLLTGNLSTDTATATRKGEGFFSVDTQTSGSVKYYRFTIDPSGVDSITFTLDSIVKNANDTLRVYEGTDSTGTVLYQRTHSAGVNIPTVPTWYSPSLSYTVTSLTGAITIELEQQSGSGPCSYNFSWESHWNNILSGWTEGKPLTQPQLKLSKVLLFDNDSLPPTKSALSIVTAPEGETLWNYSNVELGACYNMTWYNANKTAIDNAALQSIDLDQDYSLAKGYVNNKYVHVGVDGMTQRATIKTVEDNKTIATNYIDQSGKLTLNKIVYYGLNHAQTQPAHLFNYNASDSLDNPNYNALKQDYWGNYKSDADTNLLRGYVTETSKLGSDAWSLRKITSPLGGVTEIIYESDEYEQVISESQGGTMRGPVKTFAIKSASIKAGEVGSSWNIELENEDEFWTLHGNLPAGANVRTVIPAVWVDSNEVDKHGFINQFVISYGDGTLINSAQDQVDSLFYYELVGEWGTAIEDVEYGSVQKVAADFPINMSYSIPTLDLIYSGNGYINIEYPLGEELNGGGTRVKELKTINDNEVYTIKYEYDNGTATTEVGDFSFGFKKGVTDAEPGVDMWYYAALTAPVYSPFGLNPQVGYGKVTASNIGRVSDSEGKSVTLFNNEVTANDNYIKPYVKIEFEEGDNETCTTCYPAANDLYRLSTFATEIVDDYSSLWGKVKEEQLYDVNDIQISRKINTYANASKGGIVSTINFKELLQEDLVIGSWQYDILIDNINIYRKYTNDLASITTYSNGQKTESIIMERDPLTGAPNKTKSITANGTTSITETDLAYLQTTTPDYSDMGPKSDDPDNDNFLSNTYSSSSTRESEGQTLADFTAKGKGFWKTTADTRVYDATNNEYTIDTSLAVVWYSDKSYVWAGPLGDYGLFDSTAFTDISAPPTGSSDWRFVSEITLMDEAQNVLEQKGYNDRFSASKLGYDNRYTYASASNSNYVSFTATSFENLTEVEAGTDYFDGEILLNTNNERIGIDGTVNPHTGNYMVKMLDAATDGPKYIVKENGLNGLQLGRTYSASVWVHKDSPDDAQLVIDVTGILNSFPYSTTVSMQRDDADTILIGDWIQLNVKIDVPTGLTTPGATDGIEVYMKKTTTSDSAYFDDLQFKSRVTGSGMKVYDKRTGRVMATLSDNNFATKYVYNDAGQVIEVWQEVIDEGWVKVQSKDFNFARDMEQ